MTTAAAMFRRNRQLDASGGTARESRLAGLAAHASHVVIGGRVRAARAGAAAVSILKARIIGQ